MRIAMIAAGNELLRLSRLKPVLIVLFGFPVILIFLLGNAMDTSPKPVNASVYAGGSGSLKEALTAYLTSEQAARYLTVTFRGSEEAVADDLKRGHADYGFAVPDGFVNAAGGKSASGALHRYPGRFTERNLAAEAVLGAFLRELDIRTAAEAAGIPPQESGPAEGEAVQAAALLSDNVTDYGTLTSFQYYSAAYLVMFMFFGGSPAAVGILEERERGTLRRLAAMPISLGQLIAGKISGVFILTFVQAAFVIAFSRLVYGVAWGSSFGLIGLVCMLTSLTAIGLAVVVASFASGKKLFESVYSMITVVMTFLSGGMVNNLGPGLREAGKYTVNHWSNEVLRGAMNGGSPADIRQSLLVLACIAGAVIVLAALRIRKVAALS